MFYTKSQAAFVMSAEKLFAENPKQIYFWTFTFKQVHPDFRYPLLWKQFTRKLQHMYGDCLHGLRVLQVHPGGHGLHYHALLTKRVAVQIVRRLGKRYGIGRVQVEHCGPGAIHYLAQYLRPTEDFELSKGMRRWGSMGGFKQVVTANIEIESELTRNIRIIQHDTKVKQIGFPLFQYISAQTMLYGRVACWPIQKLQYVTNGVALEKVAKAAFDCDRDWSPQFQTGIMKSGKLSGAWWQYFPGTTIKYPKELQVVEPF